MRNKKMPSFLEEFCLEKSKYEDNRIPFNAITIKQFLDFFSGIDYKLFSLLLNTEESFVDKITYKYSENETKSSKKEISIYRLIYGECVEECLDYYKYFMCFLNEIENSIKNSKKKTSIFTDLNYDKLIDRFNITSNNDITHKSGINVRDKEFLIISAILKQFTIKKELKFQEDDKIIDIFTNTENYLLPAQIYNLLLHVLFDVSYKSGDFPGVKYYKNLKFFDVKFSGYQKRQVDNLLKKLKEEVNRFKKEILNANDSMCNKYLNLTNVVIEQSLLLAYLYTLEQQLVRKEKRIQAEIRLIDKFTHDVWSYDFFHEKDEEYVELSQDQRELLLVRIGSCGKKWIDVEAVLHRKNFKRDLLKGKESKIKQKDLKTLAEFLNVSIEYLTNFDVENKNVRFNSKGQTLRPFYRKTTNYERFKNIMEAEFCKLNTEEQILFLDNIEKNPEWIKNFLK